MKKILKTATAALAGILALGLAACTDGDNGFVKEEPSFYKDMGAVADTSVTAVWDFAENGSKYKEKYGDTKKLTSSGEIPCFDDGTGAKLTNITYTDIKFNGTYMQVGKNTVSLATFKEKAKDQFELTLEKNSNIQIYVTGGGGKETSRLVVITKKDDDEPIVQRDNFASTDTTDSPFIIIKGAPADTYTIYANGVNIKKIDVSGAAQVTEVKGAEDLYFEGHKDGDDFSVDGTVLVPGDLPDLFLVDTAGNESSPGNVEWTIGKNSNGKTIAIIVTDDNNVKKLLPVVTGEAKVRARVGRFVADFTLKVTGDDVTDFALFNGGDAVSEASLEALAGRMKITAKRGTDDMTKYVEWKSSAPDIAKVTDGVVTAMTKGEAIITATWSYGQDTPLEKEVKVTVTETKTSVSLLSNANLPATGTVIVWEELKDSDEKALADSKPAVLSAKNEFATYSVEGFSVANGWITKSITSNKDATDYPGILFAQANVGTPSGKLVTFKIVIKPADGKTVTLTDIVASFRANKKMITGITVGELEFETTPEKSKDWRDTRLNLKEPVKISEKTELEVALLYEGFTTGDQFSIGDIKLFFAK